MGENPGKIVYRRLTMTKLLILIPARPNLHPEILRRSVECSSRIPAANPELDCTLMYDFRFEPKMDGDERPWSRVARVRNKMLETIDWQKFHYLAWIDADVVSYKPEILSELVKAADGGIAAPMIFVEDTRRFYDWAGFIVKGGMSIEPNNRWRIDGRNFNPEPPYFPTEPTEKIVEVDCVGTIYVVHKDVILARETRCRELSEPLPWRGDVYVDDPAFTDHAPICRAVREMGSRVVVCRELEAFHAELPRYPGEGWH